MPKLKTVFKKKKKKKKNILYSWLELLYILKTEQIIKVASSFNTLYVR